MFSGNPPGAVLSSVSQLDVLNVKNSLKMLTAVDGALVRIDLERSDLGATMSRMEHTINNLSNIVMNTKAARSRINDADIAAESTELSKAQVLNQAAQAMLAQQECPRFPIHHLSGQTMCPFRWGLHHAETSPAKYMAFAQTIPLTQKTLKD